MLLFALGFATETIAQSTPTPLPRRRRDPAPLDQLYNRLPIACRAPAASPSNDYDADDVAAMQTEHPEKGREPATHPTRNACSELLQLSDTASDDQGRADEEDSPTQGPAGLFTQFTAGLNALGGGGLGAVDLETVAARFNIRLGTLTHGEGPDQQEVPLRLQITLFSRAAVNLDSVRAIAAEYVSSLQPSPLTGRITFGYPVVVSREINNRRTFGLELLAQGDIRGVPFANASGAVALGTTVHGFLTAKMRIPTEIVNEEDRELDTGSIYVEPTIFVATGQEEVFQNVFSDGRSRRLYGLDLRMGYVSDTARFQDLGFVLRWVWDYTTGARIKLSATVTP